MRTEADVVVIGAGIIGCAVALEIAARGARVDVVDSRPVGQGATQASAGMLAPYTEAHEGSALLRLAVRSLGLYDEWIARVRVESGVDVEYRRSGSLEVALDAEGAERLAALVPQFESETPMRWLDAAEARRVEPAIGERAWGALSIPTHGYVAATMLTGALARAASARGVRFHDDVRVARIEPRGDAVDVVTESGGSWRAQRVVVAAGSWTGLLRGLTDAAAADVRPVRGQLLRVEWRGRPLTQVLWGPRCYLVPWSDGTVLIGATVEEAGFEERNTAAGVRTLLEAARELLPAMDEASFIGAWVGLRPGTSDGLPFIGRSQSTERIVYATGHYRNGILLSPITARLVADLLIDGRFDPLLESISPARCHGASEDDQRHMAHGTGAGR